MNKPIRLLVPSRGSCETKLDYSFLNLFCPGKIRGSVVQNAGNWEVGIGDYIAKIFKTPSGGGSDVVENIILKIEGEMMVPIVAGDGSLIIRIPESYTDEGAVVPNNGYVGDVSWLVWVPGAIDEASIEVAINSGVPQYGYIILATVDSGVVSSPSAKYCGEIDCESIQNCYTGGGTGLVNLDISLDSGCLPIVLSWQVVPSAVTAYIFLNGVLLAEVPGGTTTYSHVVVSLPVPSFYQVRISLPNGDIVQTNYAIAPSIPSCINLPRCLSARNGLQSINVSSGQTLNVNRVYGEMEYENVTVAPTGVLNFVGSGWSILNVHGNLSNAGTISFGTVSRAKQSSDARPYYNINIPSIGTVQTSKKTHGAFPFVGTKREGHGAPVFPFLSPFIQSCTEPLHYGTGAINAARPPRQSGANTGFNLTPYTAGPIANCNSYSPGVVPGAFFMSGRGSGGDYSTVLSVDFQRFPVLSYNAGYEEASSSSGVFYAASGHQQNTGPQCSAFLNGANVTTWGLGGELSQMATNAIIRVSGSYSNTGQIRNTGANGGNGKHGYDKYGGALNTVVGLVYGGGGGGDGAPSGDGGDVIILRPTGAVGTIIVTPGTPGLPGAGGELASIDCSVAGLYRHSINATSALEKGISGLNGLSGVSGTVTIQSC